LGAGKGRPLGGLLFKDSFGLLSGWLGGWLGGWLAKGERKKKGLRRDPIGKRKVSSWKDE